MCVKNFDVDFEDVCVFRTHRLAGFPPKVSFFSGALVLGILVLF